MNQNKITIAIDGFSSSGKSTMARDLAKRIGYIYVDSGAMYRAATLFAIENGMVNSDGSIDTARLIAELPNIKISFSPAQEDGRQHTLLNGRDVESEIRGMQVSNLVSPVSAIPEVRHALTAIQQQMGREKGIVMDGRDIGTTVFPDAEMKVFVDASPEVRAKRRVLELQQKGDAVNFEEVLENIKERDRIDTTRKESPLRKAEDAHILDNDNLTIPQQMEWLLNLYAEIANKG